MLSERTLPKSVVFIGGGVISLEFGHVYARAGVKVTILEALPQLLPALDHDAVAQLQTESERSVSRSRLGANRARRIGRWPSPRRLQTQDRRAICRSRTRRQRRWPRRQCRYARPRSRKRRASQLANRYRRSSAIDIKSDRPRLRRRCFDHAPTIAGSQATKATSSAAILSRVQNHSPNYDASRRRFIPCGIRDRRPFGKAAQGEGLKIKVHSTDMLGWLSARTYAESAAGPKSIVDEEKTASSARIFSVIAAKNSSICFRWQWPTAFRQRAGRIESMPIRHFPPSRAHALKTAHSGGLSTRKPTGIS